MKKNKEALSSVLSAFYTVLEQGFHVCKAVPFTAFWFVMCGSYIKNITPIKVLEGHDWFMPSLSLALTYVLLASVVSYYQRLCRKSEHAYGYSVMVRAKSDASTDKKKQG